MNDDTERQARRADIRTCRNPLVAQPRHTAACRARDVTGSAGLNAAATHTVAMPVVPSILFVIVDAAEVDRWFRDYLDVFAACGRGESEAASLLAYYGVPLLLSTEDGFVALTNDDAVLSMAQRQVDGMRVADYDHSDVLDLEISPLNSVSALCRGKFSRRRRDEREIARLTATYLVTGARASRRISALVVHSF